jgi:Zn-dependent protease
MRSGLTLGRLFGITIHLDWSWILIFVLVTWNLAVGIFPGAHPEWGAALSWGVGLVASLLFFASVLAHELAHSLVAKARGLPVKRITLFLFGGVSNIEREPPSPAAEFLISVVGPLTSFVLGGLFLFLAQVLGGGQAIVGDDPVRVAARLEPVAVLLAWLGGVNIVLGIFNLIPGFPLDGGRVLRSILWGATGDLVRATRWASWVGQALGWVLIVGGIAMAFGAELPFFGSGPLSGLWLAFIGWFLSNAAAQSYRQVVVQDLLEGVPVDKLMRANVPTVPPEMPVSELVDGFLLGSDERAFPVLAGERLAGLVCLEDVRKVPRAEWEATPVRAIMTPIERLATIGPRVEASEALGALARRDVRQLPVVGEDGRLLGLLRQRDIMRWLELQSGAAG